DVVTIPHRMTIDQIERVSGRFKLDPAASIEQQFPLLENPVSIPRFGSVEEEQPLYCQVGDVEVVKERNGREFTLYVCIDKNEVGSHWPVTIMSVAGDGMGPQWVCRVGVESKLEIVLYRELTP